MRALDWDQIEDAARTSAGARAGDALSHARQHDRRLRHPHLAIRNRVVLTNKTPSGLCAASAGRRCISRSNG